MTTFSGITLSPDIAAKLIRIINSDQRGTLNDGRPTHPRGQSENPLFSKGRLGIIVEAGPGGETDYDDARYWIKTAAIDTDDGDPYSVPFVGPKLGDEPRVQTVTALNILEVEVNATGDGFTSLGHDLKPGTPVLIHRTPDSSDRPLARWLFWQPQTALRVMQTRLIEVLEDEIIVVPDPKRGGDTPGTLPTIRVTKPWRLRKSPFHLKTWNGISYVYTSNVEREATIEETGEVEEQVITPPYFPNNGDPLNPDGDFIYITGEIVGGTGLEARNFLDINADGRAWANKNDE